MRVILALAAWGALSLVAGYFWVLFCDSTKTKTRRDSAECPKCEICGDTENVLMLMNRANICMDCREELAAIFKGER